METNQDTSKQDSPPEVTVPVKSRIFACRIPGAMHVFHGQPIDKELSKYPEIKGKTIHFTNGWYETSHVGEIFELDALANDKRNTNIFKPEYEDRLIEELEKQRAGIANSDPLMGSFADLVNRVVQKQVAGAAVLAVPPQLKAAEPAKTSDTALREAIRAAGGRA